MCGIAGVFTWNHEDYSEQVKSAIGCILHRGPDEAGFISEPHFHFGMCRLAIIDLETGKQPLSNTSKSITVIFNGEIYNYMELRRELALDGIQFKTKGDSEVIIPLYEKYGMNFPNKLQGMFAIAIYDSKIQRGILVRDRLGKKPLWYKRDNFSLKFASEVKGLLRLKVDKELDYSALVEYLRFGYINAPRSSFKNVYQLSPGSILTFDGTQLEEKKYWELNQKNQMITTYTEAKEIVHSTLKGAVEARLISDRPIGVFLSGGVDSSLIASIMSKVNPERTKSFSIGLEDQNYDESGHARKVADFLGLEHYERVARPEGGLLIQRMAEVVDQPFADSSILPSLLLSEFARETVVVALGGDGGDEVFGGYQRYQLTKTLDQLNFLLKFNPTPSLAKYLEKYPRISRLVRNSGRMSIEKRYEGFQTLVFTDEMRQILNTELIEFIENDRLAFTWNPSQSTEILRRLQICDLNSYLPGDLLYKADMASMASSLELRSPFLDYRVVEMGLSLPDNFKYRRFTNKAILRDILSDYLPNELFNRPKQGFGIPRARWIREDMRNLIMEILFDGELEKRMIFEKNEVRKIFDLHLQGKNLDRVIWPIFAFELWARNWLN